MGVSSYGGASPGPAYPPRQLDVLLHDGDPFGVDGAQVDVLEEVDEEGLGGLLQGLDRLRLPPELLANGSEVDCDLADLEIMVSASDQFHAPPRLRAERRGGKALPAGQRGALAAAGRWFVGIAGSPSAPWFLVGICISCLGALGRQLCAHEQLVEIIQWRAGRKKS